MENDIISTVIDHLDINSYEDLYYYLLKNSEDFSSSRKLTHLDSRIIENPPERFYHSAEAFVLNYYPYSLYRDFNIKKWDLTELKQLVKMYLSSRSYDLWKPTNGTIVYAIGNYDSKKLGISDEELLEYHKAELGAILTPSCEIGIGNINTLVSSGKQNNELITRFFTKNDTGICINLSDDKILATRFIAEKEFDGIVAPANVVFQPIIKKVLDADDKLVEFKQLINADTKESTLEEFLVANHELLFGDKYDTISTQVWLDFPEIDIANKSRRLDIVMRNSLSKDWDIFELKRSSVKLTKTKADIPMFVSAVNDAIAQLKNYKYILNQDAVKRAFENKGIKYYDPSINLVIGKKPNLSQQKWNWLLTQHNELKIITYDDLLNSGKHRLNEMKALLTGDSGV